MAHSWYLFSVIFSIKDMCLLQQSKEYITALNTVLLSEHLDIIQDLIVATRALICAGIEKFLENKNFVELHKHQLSDDEWKVFDIIHQILTKLSADKTPTLALAIPSFQRIMGVRVNYYRIIMQTIMGMIMRIIIMGIIIIDYVEAYTVRAKVIMKLWKNLKIKFPKAAPAIQNGLEKLETY
ncbi:hypothetical protein ARMGADRAFT_1039876 [Armillaria gallica]|uniref:Uncharacterized protein n=1 Tax=Armillaria gallica TaxID=47427 RepID=A0A2H3CCB7_ARMGA|nr:hypothetical protein ARMGADRAFT_1039876 [Armillaria gallica]